MAESRAKDIAGRTLTIAGIVATAGVVWLHGRAYLHGGALWRDEVNSVSVATAETFGELWRLIEFESFPLL